MAEKIDAVKLLKDFTIEMKLKRLAEMRFRIWIGTLFLKLAARIIGCSIEIADKTDKSPDPLIITENDSVVLMLDGPLTDKAADRIKAQWKEFMASPRRVCLLEKGISLHAIIRHE